MRVDTRIGFIFCIGLFILASALEAQVITEGLVSYYTLDEKDIDGKTVKDVIGGKHGTMVGGPNVIQGHVGTALKFGGEPDCVELPQILKIGEDPVTYEAWFSKTDKAGWQYLVVNKTDFGSSFFRLGFNENTGQIRMYTEQADNANKAFVTPNEYVDGQWHHVVATREADVAKIYVDSVLEKEDVAMAGDLGGDRTNWFLAQNGGNKAGEYLIGAMDEVRIYSRALGEAEVKQNFEAKGLAVADSRNKLAATWGMLKEMR